MVKVGESVFCARSADVCEVVAHTETVTIGSIGRQRLVIMLVCSGCGEPLGEET